MGKFDTHGGYFAPANYFRVNTGGSHEENPNGGVQVGIDPQGIPNVLEEGEPVYDDYVFSDNITADKEFIEKHNLPKKYAGMLYSKIADSIVEEAEERPNDPISNDGLNVMLMRLADAQEEQKQIQEQQELEDMLSQMSPEELDQLDAMLAGQQEQAQPMPEAQVPVEAAAPQQMIPGAEAMPIAPEAAPVEQAMPAQMPVMATGGPLKKLDPFLTKTFPEDPNTVQFLNHRLMREYIPGYPDVYPYNFKTRAEAQRAINEYQAGVKLREDQKEWENSKVYRWLDNIDNKYLRNTMLHPYYDSPLYDYETGKRKPLPTINTKAAGGCIRKFETGGPKKQNWFTRASLGAAMADSPAIMQASGWGYDSNGNVVQGDFNEEGPTRLREALSEISTIPMTEVGMGLIGPVIRGLRGVETATDIVEASRSAKAKAEALASAQKATSVGKDAYKAAKEGKAAAKAAVQSAKESETAAREALKTAVEKGEINSEAVQKAISNLTDASLKAAKAENAVLKAGAKKVAKGIASGVVTGSVNTAKVLPKVVGVPSAVATISAPYLTLLRNNNEVPASQGYYVTAPEYQTDSTAVDVPTFTDAPQTVATDSAARAALSSYESEIADLDFSAAQARGANGYARGGVMNTKRGPVRMFAGGSQIPPAYLMDALAAEARAAVDRWRTNGLNQADRGFVGAYYPRTADGSEYKNPAELTEEEIQDYLIAVARDVFGQHYREYGFSSPEEAVAAWDAGRYNNFDGQPAAVPLASAEREVADASGPTYPDQSVSDSLPQEQAATPEVPFASAPVVYAPASSNTGVSNNSMQTMLRTPSSPSAAVVQQATATTPPTQTATTPSATGQPGFPTYRSSVYDFYGAYPTTTTNNVGASVDLRPFNERVTENLREKGLLPAPTLSTRNRTSLAQTQYDLQHGTYLSKEFEQNQPAPTNGTYPVLNTGMRYAGPLMAAGLGLYNAFQKPDRYTAQRINPVLPNGRMPLVNPVYNPIDENRLVNDTLASGVGTTRALLNSGIGYAAPVSLLAADATIGKNIGTSRVAAWDANNQQRNAVLAQANQNAGTQSQFDYGVSRDRATMLNDSAYRNAYNDMMVQRLNNAAETEKYAAIQAQLDQAADALSKIGRENFYINQVNGNTAIPYITGHTGSSAYTNKGKNGGKIKRNKK